MSGRGAARGAVTSTPARAVDVGAIEVELDELWRAAAAGADPDHPVFRASMSNLLVACRTEAEAQALLPELPDILMIHPARVLVLIAAADGAPALDAHAAIHCHLREGSRVCGESITLAARGEATRRLPTMARALVIGDLPTSLWWATPEAPALGGSLFDELAGMTLQVVFDSLGWLEPVRGMAAMRRLGNGRPLFADVCWRRLRGWRRILSQGLDPAFAPGALDDAGELVLHHGPHALTQAWLLVGWLAARLGWRPEGGKVAPGAEVTWRFRGPAGPLRVTVRRLAEGTPEVRSIDIAPAAGRHAPSLHFESGGGGRLTVRSAGPAGAVRTVSVPVPTQAAMIARQLSDLTPDPLYRDTFAVACDMAARLAG